MQKLSCAFCKEELEKLYWDAWKCDRCDKVFCGRHAHPDNHKYKVPEKRITPSEIEKTAKSPVFLAGKNKFSLILWPILLYFVVTQWFGFDVGISVATGAAIASVGIWQHSEGLTRKYHIAGNKKKWKIKFKIK